MSIQIHLLVWFTYGDGSLFCWYMVISMVAVWWSVWMKYGDRSGWNIVIGQDDILWSVKMKYGDRSGWYMMIGLVDIWCWAWLTYDGRSSWHMVLGLVDIPFSLFIQWYSLKWSDHYNRISSLVEVIPDFLIHNRIVWQVPACSISSFHPCYY